MTNEPELPPDLPTCKLVQFGPVARGFCCVYLVHAVSEETPDEERYMVRVAKVDSFGLGELTWPGGFSVEPVALILDDGMWVVADTLPGYLGVIVDDCNEREMEKRIDDLCQNLDEYYLKRLVQREAIDGE
jgi:hypothetical protein